MRDLLFQTVGASSGWRVRARRVRRRVVEGWGAGPAGRVGGRQQREMLLAMKIYFFLLPTNLVVAVSFLKAIGRNAAVITYRMSNLERQKVRGWAEF